MYCFCTLQPSHKIFTANTIPPNDFDPVVIAKTIVVLTVYEIVMETVARRF